MIIASVSGGLSSAEMLRRMIAQYGKDNVTAIFADVKGDPRSHSFFSPFPLIDELLHERFGGESHDTYRFLWQLSYSLDVPIQRIEQRETSFAHMARNKAFMINNPSGVNFAPCSLYGKRELIAAWIERAGYGSGPITLGLGFDLFEITRRDNAQYWWSKRLDRDVTIVTPLAKKPYIDNVALAQWCESAGIEVPSAYALDFLHNNCFGACVESGIGQFVLLRKVRPGVFYYWLRMEQILQSYIGTTATILKDQRGGEVNPLSLAELDMMLSDRRAPKRWQSMADQKGCACMATPMFDMSAIPIKVKPRTNRKITKTASDLI